MRNNGSITDHEILMQDGELLVSRTDTAGRITFVNDAFVKISGFTEDELIGAPHNLVRHPHMPKEAFADLWATVKDGRPWEGFVKNRTKAGDYYWVRANITPFTENGAVAGYVSIRSKPTRQQVMAAEQLYADLRNGRANGRRLREGRVEHRGFAALAARARASVAGLLLVALSVVAGVMAATTGVNLNGLNSFREALRDVYQERTIPAGQLGTIIAHTRDNIQLMTRLALHVHVGTASPGDTRATLEEVRANSARINELWRAFDDGMKTTEEHALATAFAGQRATFLEQALRPAMAAAEKGDTATLVALVDGPLTALFAPIELTAQQLLDLEIREAKASYDAAGTALSFYATLSVVLVLAGIAAALGLGVLAMRRLRAPLSRMEGAFDTISRGDLSADIADEPVVEFQRITAQLRGLKVKLGYARLEREEHDRQAETQRRADLNRVASELNERVQGIVDIIEVSSGSLLGSSQSLSDNACRTMQQASSVTAATQQVTANVQSVSAAAQELSASVVEISRQVSHATGISRDAVSQAQATDRMVRNLSEAARRIGDVVDLISDIASQTNLLALNATIEAARAGDAGKGFAVVAGEVKSLANQTARATGEITQQVAAIQAETRTAVEAIRAITDTIQSINDVSTSIAAAVEEQGAATGEIARSVEHAALGTEEAAGNVADVADAAEETRLMADQVHQAAEGLQDVSRQLSAEVSAFIADMRVA